MRIAQLDPRVTEWRDDQRLRAGAWSAHDFTDIGKVGGLTIRCRAVFHYTTRMVTFERWGDEAEWLLMEVNLGHGSVSDQGGVNKLVRGYGAYYSRKGGAQVNFA